MQLSKTIIVCLKPQDLHFGAFIVGEYQIRNTLLY